MVFFIVVSSSTMTGAIVVSTVTMRVVPVPVSVAMIMTLKGRCDDNLEFMPCHAGKQTVLDVASEGTHTP